MLRDSTYKNIDAINKIAGIATPLLIGVFGAILTIQKNEADEAKANLDRVTSTIQFLSSPQRNNWTDIIFAEPRWQQQRPHTAFRVDRLSELSPARQGALFLINSGPLWPPLSA